MVNRDAKESVMDEDTFDIIDEAFQTGGSVATLEDFEFLLSELGLMIVPIEDPTNMFGVLEDSL